MGNKIIFLSLILLTIVISGCSDKLYYSKKSISYRLDYNSTSQLSDYNKSLVYYCINAKEELIISNPNYKAPVDTTDFIVQTNVFCPTSYMTLDMKNVKMYLDNNDSKDVNKTNHFYQTAMTISDMNCEKFKKKLLSNDNGTFIFKKLLDLQLFGMSFKVGGFATGAEEEFETFKINLAQNLEKRKEQGRYMITRINGTNTKDGNYTSNQEFIKDLVIYDNQCNLLDTNFTAQR